MPNALRVVAQGVRIVSPLVLPIGERGKLLSG